MSLPGIVLVDGLPGAGVTSMARLIEEACDQNQLRSKFYSIDYPDRLNEDRWIRRFTQELEDDIVHIFDGGFYSTALRIRMYQYERLRNIIEYVEGLSGIVGAYPYSSQIILTTQHATMMARTHQSWQYSFRPADLERAWQSIVSIGIPYGAQLFVNTQISDRTEIVTSVLEQLLKWRQT